MHPKLSSWKHKIAVLAGSLGAPGLFLVSFLDSSVLTLPVINDLLVIKLSTEHPARMPLYAASATLGSVLGCILIFLLARKGEEALFQRKAGRHAAAIRHWIERNGFMGVLVAALLPPPTPFKLFVLAAGIFEVPTISFASAIAVARLFRYFAVGYLAVRYGNDALPYLRHHKLQVVVAAVVVLVLGYAISRLLLRLPAAHIESQR